MCQEVVSGNGVFVFDQVADFLIDWVTGVVGELLVIYLTFFYLYEKLPSVGDFGIGAIYSFRDLSVIGTSSSG